MPEESRRGWWLDSILIAGISAYLVWPWFSIEYLDAWASIEGTFIGDARVLRENLPHPQWNPNWYCGTRWDYIYPPALRYGTALLSKWLDISTARSYHLYTGVLYVLGLVGVYLFSRIASRRRAWSFLTAFALASVSPALMFLQHFRIDYRHNALFMPLRFGVLLRYGEGPHIASLSILGFAFAAAWIGLRGNARMLAFSSILCAFAVSNNFYGAAALAILFPILVWSLWITTQDSRVWLRAAGVAALSYGLTAVWLTPSYLHYTLRNMRLVSQPGHSWSWALEAAVLAAFASVTWRVARGKPERAFPVFAAGAVIRVGLYVVGNRHLDFRTIGEPERLTPKFDWVFLMAAAAVFAWLWRRWKLARIAVVALMLWGLYPARHWWREGWRTIFADANHTDRVEYRSTKWLHENMPASRIFVVGTVRFWYNAWFDLAEVGGGSDQGTLNLNSNVAYYEVANADDPMFSVLWLHATGTDAVVVPGPGSGEPYQDFANPNRFEGLLPVAHDDGRGTKIYRVPRRWPGLARIVDAAALAAIAPMDGVTSPETTARYAALVEERSPRQATWERLGMDRVRIRARLEQGEKLLALESFDPAWRATSNGKSVPVSIDPMRFMALDPGPGEHEILLEFTTPLENRAGAVITSVSIVLALWLLRRRRR